jgi:hypothetical protein
VSTSGLVTTSKPVSGGTLQESPHPGSGFGEYAREARVVIGNKRLQACLTEIRQLRRLCGQEDDLTTEPEYFIATNTLKNRRCAAVLIRRDQELEACVLFYEHTGKGLGVGLFRGGDYIGESLVVAPESRRLFFVKMAAEALFKHWRVHGVSISIKAPVDDCIALMGPASHLRRFCGTEIQHKLPLEPTYEGLLARLGPRTRRSLASKRQQLEKSTNVQFIPALEADQCLEVMLALETKSMPQRITEFYRARHRLLRLNSDFFSMGLRLPDGAWLSMLSGWRRRGVTYVDLQMNDMHYKRESLSAVMRAFMLEHEIGLKQELINFVGGSSLLLRRYCEPLEPCTEVFLAKPGLRTSLFEMAATRLFPGSVYERLKPGAECRPATEADH